MKLKQYPSWLIRIISYFIPKRANRHHFVEKYAKKSKIAVLMGLQTKQLDMQTKQLDMQSKQLDMQTRQFGSTQATIQSIGSTQLSCINFTTDTIAELCDKYGSDKGSLTLDGHAYPWAAHTYTPIYEMLFWQHRSAVKTVFECGLGTNNTNFKANMSKSGRPGASLYVWQDYFPNAKIYGADIDRDVLFQAERINTGYMDQTDPSSIAQYFDSTGAKQFDIMIDDGLHEFEAGKCLFENSIDKLSSNGIYVIEDIRDKDLNLYRSHFASCSSYDVKFILMGNARQPDNNLIIIKKKFVEKYSNKSRKLIFLDLEESCNLHCPSCIDHEYRDITKKLSIDTAKATLDHITSRFDPSCIALYNWAEPFLCKNISDFVELAASYKKRVTISSNMNCNIEYGVLEKIMPNLSEFIFSVSGFEQDIYEKYHAKGNINKVFYNIELALKARKATQSKTVFNLIFGRNLYNASQEELLKKFCSDNNIVFQPARYYLADVRDVYKVYNNEHIEPSKWNTLYGSYEELRADILARVRPNTCQFKSKDINFDCDGYLMTCRLTKISLPIRITDITTDEELVNAISENEFCQKCFELGLSQYITTQLDTSMTI